MACIVCLHIFSKEEASIPIDDELISDVLPQMQLKLTSQPEMCSECDDKFHEFRNFKDMCDKSENKLRYINQVPVDDRSDRPFEDCCRICLQNHDNEYQPLEEASTYTVLVKNLIPEMDLELSNSPKICKECAKLTKEFYNFQQTYLNVQNTLQEHFSDKEPLSETDLVNFAHKSLFDSSHNEDENPAHKASFGQQMDNKIFISSLDTSGNCKKKRVRKKIYSNKANFKCEFCDFKTKYKDYLKKHVQLKHDGTFNNFNCEECDFQTKDKNYLSRHAKEKHGDSQWLCCDFCDYRTKKRYTLDQHVSHRHDKSRKSMNCPECSFESKYKSSLSQHIRTKHAKSEEIFKCNECKYQTPQKRYLVSHFKETHKRNGIRYHCNYCDHNAKSNLILRRHIKLKHSDNVKLHYCPYCDHKTKFAHHLRQHIKTLHDVNSTTFRCDRCNFTTKNKHSLKRHDKEKHQENKTIFECKHCKFVTKYSTYLKKHTQINHGQSKIYDCKHCDFKTHYTSSLKKHVMAKHPHDTEMLEEANNKVNIPINEVMIKVEIEEHELHEDVLEDPLEEIE